MQLPLPVEAILSRIANRYALALRLACPKWPEESTHGGCTSTVEQDKPLEAFAQDLVASLGQNILAIRARPIGTLYRVCRIRMISLERFY